MIDSGATGRFIHWKAVQKYKLRTTKLRNEIKIRNVDNTENVLGRIKEFVYLRLRINNHVEMMRLRSITKLPPPRTWDHKIELKPGAPDGITTKIIPLSRNEQAELDKFLDEHLKRGTIRTSRSPYASPFFFVKKKDGKLRSVQDYQKLNEHTIKNRYPLPLSSDIIESLKDKRIFTKMDVHWGYNNIHIKEGDQEKAAFLTNRGLFEPMVIFFGLTNSPATFQTMMNELFKDLIMTGEVIIYMDDILVATIHMERHWELVNKILSRLVRNDLFLKPEKCTFEAEKVDYLRFIISHDKIEMDPIKVEGLSNWPMPRRVQDVRPFLGFGNFYWRFIKGVDTDASLTATGGILLQWGEDEQWHPCAYLSKGFSLVERNYDVYDRELLVIVRAFEAWRHFLEGSEHTIQIHSDHKNLTFYKDAHKLNCRQARWVLFLTWFDFEIHHIKGTKCVPDSLFRRPDFDDGRSDNEECVLLDCALFVKVLTFGEDSVKTSLKERIRGSKDMDNEIALALKLIKSAGPRTISKGIEEWNTEDGLILFRGRIYVPKDQDLHREIVWQHHDPPAMGHPGEWKTVERVQRDFWWPGMTVFIKEYIKGCAICQASKNQPNRAKIPVVPILADIHALPFQVVSTDFIMDLPLSKGFDSILVFIDHDVSKDVWCLPHAIKTSQRYKQQTSIGIRYGDIMACQAKSSQTEDHSTP
ncbi:hypothetical protein EW146_g7071 [Bondarzewia mesenterica]|uniref:Reverse transcriptase domain-containing protein n=1 Tax=Bondarzewia mesenterica TaxID=1095465 RepID=A0A4S4LNN7_9AGAM|nr:hypothetical protein EW146_g7071 [Bondarzewia mesenterica]